MLELSYDFYAVQCKNIVVLKRHEGGDARKVTMHHSNDNTDQIQIRIGRLPRSDTNHATESQMATLRSRMHTYLTANNLKKIFFENLNTYMRNSVAKGYK